MQLNKSIRNKILLLVFGTIVLLFSYLIYRNYNISYEQSQKEALDYLGAIVKTASTELDGDVHEKITNKYKTKDALLTNTADTNYSLLHSKLKRVFDANNLNTSLYTMLYDEFRKKAYFIVSSSDKPFYMHEYMGYTKDLVLSYEKGGKINSYEDEHGKWLSAFEPIKNKNGKTVAVIQADLEFSSFLKKIRLDALKGILLSLLFLIVVLFFLYKALNQILVRQEQLYVELRVKSQEINQGIEYAKHIFDSAIISQKEIQKHVPNSFVIYQPKHIISGDYYVFLPLSIVNGVCKKYVFGVFDCTGHGVSGAILSMLGLSITNNLISLARNRPPSYILGLLDKEFTKQISNHARNVNNHAAIEGALCVVDIEQGKTVFSGARRNLYYFDKGNNETLMVKGNNLPIGSHFGFDKEVYEDVTIQTNAGTNLYLFSDGITDQFIMPKSNSRKLMTKNFVSYLTEMQSSNVANQFNLLKEQIAKWKGDIEQMDDITIMGITI